MGRGPTPGQINFITVTFAGPHQAPQAAGDIWGRDNFRVFFPENGHLIFANKAQIAIFWIFFQNGSPGLMAMLDRSGSKFCVEPRSQNSESSHMSQNPI